MLKNRTDAANKLLQKLSKYKDKNVIILAIPRGGVPIGYVIAKQLNLPLEIYLSKKIGHPFNREYAIGSVTLHGNSVNSSAMDVSQEYIDSEIKRITEELRLKFKLYMKDRPPTNLKNKIVILIDDGIATGNTLQSSIDAIKENEPSKIVVAVPVAPPKTAQRITLLVDEFICLLTPVYFSGVGQFYYDFSPVSDDEVIKLLQDLYSSKHTAQT